MRVIKFRQCHLKRSGEFSHFSYWGLNIGESGSYFIGPQAGGRIKPSEVIHEQFTGLHDKNGKEIYEGDIIKSRFDCSYSGKVIFKDGCFVVETAAGHTYCLGDNNVSGDAVIGNIHQNPELLA